MTTKAKTPTLSLSRDGYSIETVFGPWMSTCWILLHKTDYDYIEQVAGGFRYSYVEAQRDAYEAFMDHKQMMAAKG